MRPPEFTGGNDGRRRPGAPPDRASMRPPEFTGGNAGQRMDRAGMSAPLQ